MRRTRGLLVASFLLLLAGCSDDALSPTPPLATGTWDVVLSLSGVDAGNPHVRFEDGEGLGFSGVPSLLYR